MNEVSLYNPLSVQGYGAGSAAVKTTGQELFASLLAMQMQQALQQGVSSGTASASSYSALDAYSSVPFMLQNQLSGSLTDAADGEGGMKDILLMLCLMMCSGSQGGEGGMGGMDSSMMMSLVSAMTGVSGTGAASASGNVKKGSFDLTGVTSGLQAGTKGAAIVQAALTRLGDPYSKAKRDTGKYVDCSSFVRWAYKQVGISLPGTSVMQAKYCHEKGYTISKEELQPGDLVFWSKKDCDCGRWKEIHHVGIYAGDGKVVEAKPSTGGVSVNDIWGEDGRTWKIVMYARPYADK